MKKVIILFLIFILKVNLFSQKEIGVIFNSCHSGRTLDLMYGSRINNTKFLFGISTNINKIVHEDDLQLYHKKRLFVSGIENLFGLHFAYNKYFKINIIDQEIYLFSDLQLKYAGTRNSIYTEISYNQEYDKKMYKNEIVYYGPFVWVQNTYGLGFDVHVYKKIYLAQKIGYGFECVVGKDSRDNPSKKKAWIYGSLIFNFGFSYRL
jgi:hypothetical protein